MTFKKEMETKGAIEEPPHPMQILGYLKTFIPCCNNYRNPKKNLMARDLLNSMQYFIVIITNHLRRPCKTLINSVQVNSNQMNPIFASHAL
uniref:CSON013569 protein n=1 Tax=Culicoides sonorensis TaxID=179676 RepID=A0A336KQ75_CULSO